MRLNPHLTFNGQCEAAFKFYEDCLGGRITWMMKNRETPSFEPISPDWGEKIAHATIAIGEEHITGGDSLPECYQRPQGFSLLLCVDSVEEAERIFERLSEHGMVQMPLGETFWALRFGMVADQFGAPWTINCGKEM